MVATLMGLYFGLVWLLFTKMKIPWTKNRIVGVVVSGLGVLLILLLGWHISAPTVADGAMATGPAVRMRTDVGGRVVKVWITEPRDVKKGEPLFQVDPDTYEYQLKLAAAQLKQAQEDVRALGASYEAAVASEEQATTHVSTKQAAREAAAAQVQTVRDQIDAAKQSYARAKADLEKAVATAKAADATAEMVRGAFKSNAASELQLTEAERNAEAAAAGVKASVAKADEVRISLEQTLPSQLKMAQAQEVQAERAVDEARSAVKASAEKAREIKIKLGSTIDGEHTLIRQAREKHKLAKWDFEHTTTYAPVDGYVVQAVLREGDMVRALDEVMTIISSEESWIIAQVPQYLADFVEEGNAIEVAFDVYPGQVFKGVVERRLWFAAGAQPNASGSLPDATQIQQVGPYAVRIRLHDVPAGYPVRYGAKGTASIYTNHWKPFALIQKMVINMQAWTNYLG